MKPSIETAKKLADALEVSLDYLVGDAELKMLDKKTLQRIQDIEMLPEEERKVIYKVLDSLLRDFKAKQAYS
jgi:transcriptional regulator with XRE-family HTH domain